MHQLAFIALIDDSGKELKIPASDVREVREVSVGAVVVMRDGTTYQTQTTAADIFTAINTLWTAYLTALGDPT